MTTTDVNVAACFDHRWNVPFLVFAESLRRSMRHVGRKLILHAIHLNDLPQAVADIVRFNTDLFEIRFVLLKTTLEHFSVSRHLTHATYARLELPELLPEVDRVLYLDVDLLVLRSVGALYDSDLNGFPLGACNDFALTIYAVQTGLQIDATSCVTSSGGIDIGSYLRETVGLSAGQERRYFNAGVLLIDLKLWRERQISAQVAAKALAHPDFVFHDQDAFNAVLWGDYQELDHRWNAAASCANVDYLQRSGATALDVAADWASDPYIVHYSGSAKPWNPRNYRTDYDWLFWRFARQAHVYKAALDLMPRDLRHTDLNSDKRSRVLAKCRRWLGA